MNFAMASSEIEGRRSVFQSINHTHGVPAVGEEKPNDLAFRRLSFSSQRTDSHNGDRPTPSGAKQNHLIGNNCFVLYLIPGSRRSHQNHQNRLANQMIS
jgi:hypothetical protein